MTTGGSVTISGTLTQSSDARLKKDVKPLENSLDNILKLNGVTYNWIDPKKDPTKQIGVIAQEVEKVYPELVKTDEKGLKSVAYPNLVAPLINAVKELYQKWFTDSQSLHREIASVKTELDSKSAKLEAENQKLSEQNKMMKQYLCAKDPDAPFCH